MDEIQGVSLDEFDNRWYEPGRAMAVQAAWLLISGVFFQTWFPWPSRMKVVLLRVFGASIGSGVVIKPRVIIKFPWKLAIGNHSWIGEGVWLDTLAATTIGSHVCISQGAMVETGSHDWSDRRFGLVVSPVTIEDGVWVAARALVLPGAILKTGSVIGAGSVIGGGTEPDTVYRGNPAAPIKRRSIRAE